MALYLICHVDDLAEGECLEFEIPIEKSGTSVQGFLVRHLRHVHAYRNQCPHTGVTLNWVANQFMDTNNQFIQCATHGALFRIDDGYCVRGPCAGASLQELRIITSDNNICLQWDDDERLVDETRPKRFV